MTALPHQREWVVSTGSALLSATLECFATCWMELGSSSFEDASSLGRALATRLKTRAGLADLGRAKAASTLAFALAALALRGPRFSAGWDLVLAHGLRSEVELSALDMRAAGDCLERAGDELAGLLEGLGAARADALWDALLTLWLGVARRRVLRLELGGRFMTEARNRLLARLGAEPPDDAGAPGASRVEALAILAASHPHDAVAPAWVEATLLDWALEPRDVLVFGRVGIPWVAVRWLGEERRQRFWLRLLESGAITGCLTRAERVRLWRQLSPAVDRCALGVLRQLLILDGELDHARLAGARCSTDEAWALLRSLAQRIDASDNPVAARRLDELATAWSLLHDFAGRDTEGLTPLEGAVRGRAASWTPVLDQVFARGASHVGNVLKDAEHHPNDPAVALAAARSFQGTWSPWKLYPQTAALHDLLGPLLIEAIVQAAERMQPRQLASIHGWAVQIRIGEKRLHLNGLRSGSQELEDEAIRWFAEVGPEDEPAVVALVDHGQARVRTTAVRCLARLGTPGARAALVARLKKERAAAVKEALEEALRQSAGGEPPAPLDEGIYRRAEPFSVQTALSSLRGLLTDAALAPKPSLATWIRVCDLVERLRAHGGLPVALDYLAEQAPRLWPDELRLRPWGWDDEPALVNLAPTVHARDWVPISVLHDPARRDALFDAVLPVLEVPWEGYQEVYAPLVREHVESFVEAVERGWFWCMEQQCPVEALEVRYNGGESSLGSARTTTLDLFQGWGVELWRPWAGGGPSQRRSGLRYVRVALPKGHPLRKPLNLKGRQKLDIKKMIA